MDWLATFVEKNGLDGAIFLAVCYACYWLAENAVKPLVAAHIDFLSTYKRHMVSTDEWLECHAESLKTLATNDAGNSNTLERMADHFDRLQCRGGR